MKIDLWSILLRAFLPLVLQTTLYFLAFKVRRIHISFLNCVTVGGASYLVGAVPIPLPELLRSVFAVGVAMFLITRYTEAELFPDVICIPIVVHLVSPALQSVISL